MSEIEKQENDYQVIQTDKKNKYKKVRQFPDNYDKIEKWKMPEIKPEIIKGPFLEESSFATLFPKYREKYIKEVFTFVQKALRQQGIKAELDLLEGSMTVRTTKKTFDPYAIIKARDIIKLLARSVPYEVCLRLLNDDIYCDVIKIKSFVRNKEKFIKRRKRLIGPNGDTIKALEILTECYILVQGHTVSLIGHYKKLKSTRRIIEGIMSNTHPVYYIKDLMIKKELMNDEQLKDQSWDRFLPKFKTNNQKTLKKKKIKKTKDKSQFPNPPMPRKIDAQMESGEYFLSEEQKKKYQLKLQQEKSEKKKMQNVQKRIERYQEPNQEKNVKEVQKKENPSTNINDKEVKDLVKKFQINVKEKLLQLIFQQFIQIIAIMKFIFYFFLITRLSSGFLKQKHNRQRSLSGNEGDNLKKNSNENPKIDDENNPKKEKDKTNPTQNDNGIKPIDDTKTNPTQNDNGTKPIDDTKTNPTQEDNGTKPIDDTKTISNIADGKIEPVTNPEQDILDEKKKFQSTFEVTPLSIQTKVFSSIAQFFQKDKVEDQKKIEAFIDTFIFYLKDGKTWISYKDFVSLKLTDIKYPFALKQNLNAESIFEIKITMNVQTKKEIKKQIKQVNQSNKSEDTKKNVKKQSKNTQTVQDPNNQKKEIETIKEPENNKKEQQQEREELLIEFNNQYFQKKIYCAYDVFGVDQFYKFFKNQLNEIFLMQSQVIHSIQDIQEDLLIMLIDNFNENSSSGQGSTSDGFSKIKSLRDSSKKNIIDFEDFMKLKSKKKEDQNQVFKNEIKFNAKIIKFKPGNQNAIKFYKESIKNRSQILFDELPKEEQFLTETILFLITSENALVEDILIFIFKNKNKVYFLIDSENYVYEKEINFLTKANVMQQLESQVVFLKNAFIRQFAYLESQNQKLINNQADFEELFKNLPQGTTKITANDIKQSSSFNSEIKIDNSIKFIKSYPLHTQFKTSILAIDYFKNLYNDLFLANSIEKEYFKNDKIISFYPLIPYGKNPTFIYSSGLLNFVDVQSMENQFLDLTQLGINQNQNDFKSLQKDSISQQDQKRVYYAWNTDKNDAMKEQYLFKIFSNSKILRIL